MLCNSKTNTLICSEQLFGIRLEVKVIRNWAKWEQSGSVVECLTRDREAPGSSLTGVSALCPSARTLILA